MMTYEQLAAQIAEWAQTQPSVRAVIACGSWARGTADRWSDLDLLMFTTERDHYAADSAWLAGFGDLWLAYREPTDEGDSEWYALYEGGVKLDIVVLQVENPTLDLDALLKLYPYQGVFGRGVKVLYDRLGAPRDLAPEPFETPAPPTAAEFAQVVNGFLIGCATVAKFIARGDVWRAQLWFANDLRVHLLRILAWHAHGRDTWYSGRFFDSWADPRALAALPRIFPAYEALAMRQALREILDLFHQFGKETAERFDLRYPADTHERIADLIETIFSEEKV
jgi:aminoglycoside 6-adenylyltransferase